MLCKSIISIVSCRHSHYGTCSITCQDIISYPNRYKFLCKWMHGVSSCEYSRNCLHICHSFPFGTLGCSFYIGFYLSPLFLRSDFQHQFVFGSKSKERYTKNCIRTSSENFYFSIYVFNLEFHRSPRGFSNPVFLAFFNALCPI